MFEKKSEETLNPTDWDAMRLLGHRMVDDMMHYLSTLKSRPAWQPLPESVRTRIQKDLPIEGSSFESVYDEFKSDVLPYPNGNIHPRFWGWVQGTGTPFAMLADMLASGMNPHMAGFQQAPAVVETTVIEWLKTLMGFPPESSGLLTSGGTMANLIGLAVARNAKSNGNFRETGFQDSGSRHLVVYASVETHSWAKKSMELLGFGNRSLRIIDVNQHYQINISALKQQIAIDREKGFHPLAVLGTAGTVNTGAVDDLDGLADLCRDESLWFHIDGAFGALARLSPAHSHLVKGLDRADSVAFDLHKWMYLPFEAGCILIRHPGTQNDTFAQTASYLASTDRGVSAGPMIFADLGIELTRGFKALKVWMSLKAHGANQFGRLIGQNIDQVQYLASLIQNSTHLQLMAPVSLNVACFRFYDACLSATQLDAVNIEVLLRVQERGIAVPSGTKLSNQFVLR